MLLTQTNTLLTEIAEETPSVEGVVDKALQFESELLGVDPGLKLFAPGAASVGGGAADFFSLTAGEYWDKVWGVGKVLLTLSLGVYVVLALLFIGSALLTLIFGIFTDVVVGIQMSPFWEECGAFFELRDKSRAARVRGYNLSIESESTPQGRVRRGFLSKEGVSVDLGVGQVTPVAGEEYISLVNKGPGVVWPINYENRLEGVQFVAEQFFLPFEYTGFIFNNFLSFCGNIVAPAGSLIGTFQTFAGSERVEMIFGFTGAYEQLESWKTICLTFGIEALALKSVFMVLSELNLTFQSQAKDWVKRWKVKPSTLLLCLYAGSMVAVQFQTKTLEEILIPVATPEEAKQLEVQVKQNKINITTASILAPGFIRFATEAQKGPIQAGRGGKRRT